MNETKKRFLSVLCLGAILLTGALFGAKNETLAAGDDPATQIKNLEKDLAGVRNERSAAQQALNRAKSGKSAQIALKEQYDREIVAIDEQLRTTESLIEQYELSISETQQNIEELVAEQGSQQELFDEMVRMSFEYGSDSYLELLFGAEDFSDFLSRIDLISYHLSYNRSVIEKMKEVEDNLHTNEENLRSSKENLENYKQSKETLREEFETKSAESTALISRLADDEAEAAAALKIIQESEKKLQNDIEALTRELNSTSTYSGGKFKWPLATSGTNTSGWEWRTNPITKRREFHNGIDIAAPKGTNIYAAADGTVVKCEWYGGYGNCVIINHGGGVMTLYGHCNSLNGKNGQSVKAGDVIAYVGTTGQSTGYHLHFTVYEGKTAVNPWNYLK